MSEVKVHEVPGDLAKTAHVNAPQYQEMYQRSVQDPEGFWAEQAEKYVTWFSKWDKVLDWSFSGRPYPLVRRGQAQRLLQLPGPAPGHTRRSARHHLGGGRPHEDRTITYRELHDEVCRFANVLKSRGVKKGDRVSIYMPMIPEAAVAMLACTRIGRHPLGGVRRLLARRLRDRIQDSATARW
jgi:acetyl-CoA synthetase